jgi:hypothetical protein
MAGKANFSVIKGDTFSRTPTFRRKNTKAPVDLTGSTISGKVKQGTFEIALTCSVPAPLEGKFTFTLSSAQTATLPTGVCTIEVQVTYPDTTIQTLITGNLVVQEQVA